nr:isocitrate dehydrogenase [NAD] regulatory subunit 1, mitochondrial [Tanacetum cinerariifolium]
VGVDLALLEQDRLENYDKRVIWEGKYRTKYLGGSSTTQEVIDAVISNLDSELGKPSLSNLYNCTIPEIINFKNRIGRSNIRYGSSRSLMSDQDSHASYSGSEPGGMYSSSSYYGNCISRDSDIVFSKGVMHCDVCRLAIEHVTLEKALVTEGVEINWFMCFDMVDFVIVDLCGMRRNVST